MSIPTGRRAPKAATSRDAAAFLAGPAADWERDLSTYFAVRTSPATGRLRAVALHPHETVAAIRAILRLPRLDVRLGEGAEARAIRRNLTRTAGVGRLPVLRDLVDVLPLPARPGEYTRGRARQTLRQRIRAATDAGVTYRTLDPEEDLGVLLARTELQERTHPMTPYRLAHPDNSDLRAYRHLLLASAADGEPLLLVAVAVEGPFAMLRYFGTLGHGDVHSDARFLMAGALVDHLAPLGVRYLFNSRTPFTVPAGLRHFQRMLGWRLCRVRLQGGRIPR